MAQFKTLAFNIQAQDGDYWCWAAVSASVSHFYNSRSTWNQCKVAGTALRRNDCCPNPRKGQCDKIYYLDEALKITGNLASPIIEDPLSFDNLKAQINAKKVVGARIRWQGGQGHFVVLHGYQIENADNFVFVADPLYGKKMYPLRTLLSNYQMVGGEWSHSYLTKSDLPPIMLEVAATNKTLLRKALRQSAKLIASEYGMKITSERKEVTASANWVYQVDTPATREGGMVASKQVGYRILNEDKKLLLLYDFNSDQNDAELQQITYDQEYNRRYQTLLHSIVERFKDEPQTYTVRILLQPSLKLEAFWVVNREDASKDRFIPLHSVGSFEEGEFYAIDEFNRRLLMQISAVDTGEDPLIGS
ncbi:MAG TPA: papain-like cysteine protease family protein [Flavisolibacter sp.]|nr:papain-like cysteine protease family protein [Flavisolibacter sp.]